MLLVRGVPVDNADTLRMTTYGLAAADISTGRFTVGEAGRATLGAELARLESMDQTE